MSQDSNRPYETPPMGYPGLYGPPTPHVPLHATVSPYLNIDPSIFRNQEPQYIMPEGANPRRGRFELAFSQIGGSVMAGACFGGANGLFKGLSDPLIKNEVWSVRRTQMLNYITTQGGASASSLGVLAVMYAGIGTLLSFGRKVDDELNTLIAGTATGLLYKSSAGLRRCAIGGAVGFGIAAAYCLITSRDRLKEMLNGNRR